MIIISRDRVPLYADLEPTLLVSYGVPQRRKPHDLRSPTPRAVPRLILSPPPIT